LFQIELSQEEIELVLSTLVYDGRLEEVQSSVLLLTGYATGKKMYKASKMIRTPNYLTETPCGVCPVVSQCCDGGVVSPATCPYMTQWLDMNQEQPEDAHAAAMYSW
jgi:DNA-directed RNA polymerase III subunit RPC6